MLDTVGLDARDLDALRRAMDMPMEPRQRAQLESKLADGEPWRAVAAFAAYASQCRTLRLKPWNWAPAWGKGKDPKANALLERMLKHGVSQYEPDPLAALGKRKSKVSNKNLAPNGQKKRGGF